MKNYPEIPLPSRSDSLWRYTSWKKIHPSKIEEMPKSTPISFSEGEDFDIDDSTEIARSFIHSISPVCKKISLTNETLDLDLESMGSIASGELYIES